VLSFAGATRVAADLVSVLGDADGFGLFAPIENGRLWVDELGGQYFTDYREVEELATAPQTDLWATPGFNPSMSAPWTHTYVADFVPSDAVLTLYLAGIADFAPAELLVDGHSLATLNFAGQPQTTHIVEVPVPAPYLDGSTQFRIDAHPVDGYILDFASLTIVPEPTSLVLLLLGALATASRKFRRRTR